MMQNFEPQDLDAAEDITFEQDGFLEESEGSIEPTLAPGALLFPLIVLVIGGLLAFCAIKLIAPISARLNANTREMVNHATSTPYVSMLAPFFTPEVKRWEPQIMTWAKLWNLDANLVATIMQIESCGDPHAVSSAGAMGLFQVMPFHFEAGEDAYDPQVNAQRGLDYLRKAFNTRKGDIRATLASYNGGINGASQPEAYWSEQMLRYTRWGNGIYQEALQGSPTSKTLQEWLNAGGSSLCVKASQSLSLTR